LGEKLSEELFLELERQLRERGVVLKKGTLMDATLVEAQVRRPSLKEGRGAKSPTDPDAEWTYSHRGRRAHFGYKVHIGVAQGSGLVRTAASPTAKVYESEVADDLVSRDEEAVYGDKASESKRRRLWLRSLGIEDRTMHRSHKVQRGLPHWQQRHNELISPVRSAVEKVFGTLKRSYRYHRVRYQGLEWNAIEMWFKVMAYNLRRSDRIAFGSA
jgi:IS5 family transposase